MIKFNTQICTTREQSNRLIELGLNPNTSDMHHYRWSEGYWDIQSCPPRGTNSSFIPAWSLHRLIELCGIDRMPISFGKKGRVRIRVNYIHPTHDGRSGYNYYDSLIDCIEWLIQNNYFNKEYLNQ